jgi:hypothetical protein
VPGEPLQPAMTPRELATTVSRRARRLVLFIDETFLGGSSASGPEPWMNE